MADADVPISPESHEDQLGEYNAVENQESTGSLLIREIRRAAMVWVVIYGLLFAWLLCSNWQANGRNAAEYQRRLEAMEHRQPQVNETPGSNETVSLENGNWWLTHEETLNNLVEELRDRTNDLNAATKRVQQNGVAAKNLNLEIQKLNFQFSSATGDVGLAASSSLPSLLNHGQLSEIQRTAILDHLFVQSMKDLSNILEHRSTVNWPEISALLQPEKFPAKQASSPPNDFTCPNEIDVASTRTDPVVPPDVRALAARKKDLQQAMRKFNDLLKRRVGPHDSLPSLLMPKSVSEVDRMTRQLIEEVLQTIVEAATHGTPSQHHRQSSAENASCLTQDQVLEIVDEGLLAIHKKADLRNTLRKKVLELDPKATKIILDADLPLPSPILPQQETINLRRVLDGPIISHYLAPWIDQLVELSGGYNEHLDQWLDSLVSGRESVGETAVKKLLQESGKVTFPRAKLLAQQHLPPVALQMMKKYNLL